MGNMYYDPFFEHYATDDILSLLNLTSSSIGLNDGPNTTTDCSDSGSCDGIANILLPVQSTAYDQFLLPSEAGLPQAPLHQHGWSPNLDMKIGPASTLISADPQNIDPYVNMSFNAFAADMTNQRNPPSAVSLPLLDQFAQSLDSLSVFPRLPNSWLPANPLPPSPTSPSTSVFPSSSSSASEYDILSPDDGSSYPSGSHPYKTRQDNLPKPSSHMPHTSRRRCSLSSSTSSTLCPLRRKNGQSSRNGQIYISPEAFERALRDRPYKCPGCGHASKNFTDLRRHMNTHRAKVFREMWVCCGLPIEEARQRGLEVDDAHVYNGHKMVGGCKKSFTRKDALVRHLRESDEGCCGDVELALANGILGPRSIAQENETHSD